MKNIKTATLLVLMSSLFIGAGCTSSVTTSNPVPTKTSESFTTIGDLYLELPNSNWTSEKTESNRKLRLVSPDGSITDVSVSEMSMNPVDVSKGTPAFTNDYANIYRDGCGGGWCAFYIINFHDGAQYDIIFTGDPINDIDMEVIMTSVVMR